MLPTGTTWNFGFNGTKTRTTARSSSYNPAINSDLIFGFTQPLLRRPGGRFTRSCPLRSRRAGSVKPGTTLKTRFSASFHGAENAYWDVVFAREQLKVQESNLALNEDLLKRSRRELELGAISQLDIYQPEAQYKNAELSVTQARYRLQVVEDALRRQIALISTPRFAISPSC